MGWGIEERILHYSTDSVLPQESVSLIEKKKSKRKFLDFMLLPFHSQQSLPFPSLPSTQNRVGDEERGGWGWGLISDGHYTWSIARHGLL